MCLEIKDKINIIKNIKIPEHEKICESYWEYSQIKYIITETIFKKYILYSVSDLLKIEKLEEKDNPKEFKKYKRSKEFLEVLNNEKE